MALIESGDILAGWNALDPAGRRAVVKEQIEHITIGPYHDRAGPGHRPAQRHRLSGVRTSRRNAKAGQPSHLGSAGPLGVQAGYAWVVSWALGSALALEVLGALA